MRRWCSESSSPDMSLFSFLFPSQVPKEHRKLLAAVKSMTGVTPKDPWVYLNAFRRKGNSKSQHQANLSYERLEYLGDAVLGVLLAEYLFDKYPKGDEGYLTSMRSKVVSRKALNRIAEKMGISKWMSNSRRGGRGGHTSVPGNTLEALVGAVYADRGWKATRTFVFKHMIEKHVNINSVEREIVSYKSLLIEWVQQNKKRFDFVLQDEEGSQHRKRFVFKLLIDDKEVSEGSGPSKKTAEEAASKAACYELNIHRRGNKPSRSRRPQRKRPS